MVTVANSPDTLKKRLNRFFSLHSPERAELNLFLNDLGKTTDFYIFGGMIRDIALHGVDKFNSDIDIVYDTNAEAVEFFVNKYIPNRNKFGGYRLAIGKWQIDIWDAQDSWAFAQGHRKYSDITSLLDTTITNWESALFDWNNKKLISKDDYIKDLVDGYVELLLKQNPNEMGMLVRLLRLFVNDNTKELSPTIVSALYEGVRKYSFHEIHSYESNSYGNNVISEKIYFDLKTPANLPDLLPFGVKRPDQKNLF